MRCSKSILLTINNSIMLTIVLFVVVVAIYAVAYVVKSLMSGNVDVKGTPVMGEAFPKIDVYNGFNDDTKEQQIVQPAEMKSKKPLNTSNNFIGEKTVVVEKEKKEKHFSLKKRSDARRAFIHAEILNRKY